MPLVSNAEYRILKDLIILRTIRNTNRDFSWHPADIHREWRAPDQTSVPGLMSGWNVRDGAVIWVGARTGTTATCAGRHAMRAQVAGTGPGVGTGFSHEVAAVRGLRHVPEQADHDRLTAAAYLDYRHPHLIDAAKVDVGYGTLDLTPQYLYRVALRGARGQKP